MSCPSSPALAEGCSERKLRRFKMGWLISFFLLICAQDMDCMGHILVPGPQRYKSYVIKVSDAKDTGIDKQLGYTYYEYALMWNRTGEIEKAREYFERSLDIFKEINLKIKINEVMTALRNLESK